MQTMDLHKVTVTPLAFFGRSRKSVPHQDSNPNAGTGGNSNNNIFLKAAKFLGMVVVAGLVLVGGMKLLSSSNFSSNAKDKNSAVKSALAAQDINKEYSFPLKNSKNEQIGSLKYMVEKAELMDEIVIKGQKATAVAGREFIVLTIKISNDFKQSISINTRDYVRLSVNGNEEELLAPDIHNDPVEVQAISTKYTRLGFPINTSDEKLVLLVGEINGEKERIELNLQ